MPEKDKQPIQVIENADKSVVNGMIISESFSGPLPPPSILAGYDSVVPGAAERIIKMAETQSLHRQQLEAKVISSKERRADRGQLFGFFIGITGIVAAVILAVVGHEVVAGVVGGSTLIGLVSIFVIGKQQQSVGLSERKSKIKTAQEE